MSDPTRAAAVLADPPVLDGLAALLQYPGEDYHARVEAAVVALAARDSAAAEPLRAFLGAVVGDSTDTLQERYTATFDHGEDCALEVGWHVYGETYQRGVFMAQMRDLLRQVGVAESRELPDHLGHLLQAVSRMPAKEARRLVRITVKPALGRIARGLEGKQSPYRTLLRAIQEVLTEGSSGGGDHE